MLDADAQRQLFNAVVAAAAEEGCYVAPVGSLYFLFQGPPRGYTKDVDAVVHDSDLKTVNLKVLERIANRLGDVHVTLDEAMVQVRTTPEAVDPDVELIRGRSASKGFFPRPLVEEAAKASRKEGNVLIYPVEYILVLKADAAIDRETRAARHPERAEENRRRAAAFRADVFAGVNDAMLGKGLDGGRLESGVRHLMTSRQRAVVDLLRAAGAPL